MRFLRRGLVGWLLLALLWAPTLGLLHRHVHVPHGASPAAVEVAHAGHGFAAPLAEATPPGHAAHGAALHHWIASLFAGHGQAADCLLYDQCNVADALVSVALTPPAAVPVFLLHIAPGTLVVRWVARYNARGPPPVR